MTMPNPLPFVPDWPDLDPYLLDPPLPPAPPIPLHDVLPLRLAAWVATSAESKCAPPDYVLAGLLAVAASTIGNARWAAPRPGWTEATALWAMCVGLPSAGKSPALDAALRPLRKAERPLRDAAEAKRAEWSDRAELAKIVEATWKEQTKAALKSGDTPPSRPKDCDAGPPPALPRLVVNDATVESLAIMLAERPRGLLQMRDELAGWLEGMQRYTAGSDRAFWLEAYGGRSFAVERVGRGPQTVDHLTIGVLGGIQPDRLNSLLMGSDDDGLLARFLPVWPAPIPLKRPEAVPDDALIDRALQRLLSLDLVPDDDGGSRPWLVPFTTEADTLLFEFQKATRLWEAETEGLLLSFIGKLPGLSVRLALVLTYLDWATGDGPEPREITAVHYGRAAHMVQAYLLPMARRTYAVGSVPKPERLALLLVDLIRTQGWDSFTSRDVLRMERNGLKSAKDLNPVLTTLESGGAIKPIDLPPGPQGGRKTRLFAVNPALHRGRP